MNQLPDWPGHLHNKYGYDCCVVSDGQDEVEDPWPSDWVVEEAGEGDNEQEEAAQAEVEVSVKHRGRHHFGLVVIGLKAKWDSVLNRNWEWIQKIKP